MNLWRLCVDDDDEVFTVGIFDDAHKSEAEQIAKLIGGEVEVRPLVLNEFKHEEPPEGMQFFFLHLDENGEVTSDYSKGYSVLHETGTRRREGYAFTPKNRAWDRKTNLSIQMYAPSLDVAIREARKILARVIGNDTFQYGDLPSQEPA